MAKRMHFTRKKTQLLKIRKVTIENNSVARNIVSSLAWRQRIDRIEDLVISLFCGCGKKLTRRKKNLEWNIVIKTGEDVEENELRKTGIDTTFFLDF